MGTKRKEIDGLVIIQPSLEPWPSAIKKIGKWAVFFYVRWSSIGVGIEILHGGFAVVIGPAMVGICHIEKQLSAKEPRP